MSAGPAARTASRSTAGLGALLFCAALGSASVLGFAPFYFWLVAGRSRSLRWPG